MYVGTNDKDTYKQELPTNEAKQIVNDIRLKYLDVFTIQDAEGMWKNEKNIRAQETTLICYFDNTNIDTIHQIADEVLISLNQEYILIEETDVKAEYYRGHS